MNIAVTQPDPKRRETEARARFKSVRLRPPFLRDAQRTLETVRAAGRATRGRPQPIVPIIGPSQSGKTTIIDDFCERIAKKEGVREGVHPVLSVTLTANSTMKSLGFDIVNALGDDSLPHEAIAGLARQNRPSRRAYTVTEILHVAVTAMKNASVELLVLDEMHHLRNLDSERTKWSVTESVKWLSIQGVCPIVCLGIRRLTDVISASANAQLAARCVEPIWLEPLDFEIEDERQTFMGFIDGIDEEMVNHGIFERRADFLQRGWPERFYDFSLGIIGRASRLIEAAMVVAIRAGHARIELEDLSLATRTWGMRLGFTDFNPWAAPDAKLRDLALIRELAKRAS